MSEGSKQDRLYWPASLSKTLPGDLRAVAIAGIAFRQGDFLLLKNNTGGEYRFTVLDLKREEHSLGGRRPLQENIYLESEEGEVVKHEIGFLGIALGKYISREAAPPQVKQPFYNQ